jgi:hypothetical protein
MCESRSTHIVARSRACDRLQCCARIASPTARVSPLPRRRSRTRWCLARGSVQLLRNRELAAYRRRCCHRMLVRRRQMHRLRRWPMRHTPCSHRRLLSRHRPRGLQMHPRSLARRRPSRASAHRSHVRARTLQQQPQSRRPQVRHQVRHQAGLPRRPPPRLLRSKCRKRRLRQTACARTHQPLLLLPLQQLLLPPRLRLLPQLPTLRRPLAAPRQRRPPRLSRVRQRRWFRSRRSTSQAICRNRHNNRFKMKAPRISGALPQRYQLDATDFVRV